MNSDEMFPANVHFIKPRKLVLSDRLDRFLNENALAPKVAPTRCDPTRPKPNGINAITCTSCGQAEYNHRDHCRCGHYLRGQLEDEYLDWEARIHSCHGSLSEQTDKRLCRLRLILLPAMPFLVAPLLLLALQPGNAALIALLWMIPGLLILGAFAILEQIMTRALRASASFIGSYTFDDFVEQKHQFQNATTVGIDGQWTAMHNSKTTPL